MNVRTLYLCRGSSRSVSDCNCEGVVCLQLPVQHLSDCHQTAVNANIEATAAVTA